MKLGKNSFINKISKAFPKKSCDNLIGWCEQNLHLAAPGKMGSGYKLNNLEICLYLKNDHDHYNLGKTLIKCIKQFKKIYPEVDKYLGSWSLYRWVQLMRYEPGNFYHHIHCENEGHPPHFDRAFAWTIFLNTIKKGGGTKFIYQNIVAKPVAGDFYIWPAGWTHFHQGVNAPNEKKYILTGWITYIH